MGMSRAARIMMMNGDHHSDKMEHRKDQRRDDDYREHDNAMAVSKDSEKLDCKVAEKWVAEMDKPGGAKGGKWNYDQTTQLMKQKNYTFNAWEFYAVLNMIYSDYGETLTKHGVTSVDAYAELACDWLEDSDISVGDKKTALYYHCIVK